MTIAKRGRPHVQHAFLTNDVILMAAKKLMRDTGKEPSIRQLARALGSDPMAIYHYYKNKKALLEALAVSLIKDIYEPEDTLSWKDELYKLSQGYLRLLIEYPSLLETLLAMQSTSPAVIYYERFQRILAPLMLGREREKNALDLLVDYIHGYAMAMKYNEEHPMKLDLDMMKGPFNLLCDGLECIKDNSSA